MSNTTTHRDSREMTAASSTPMNATLKRVSSSLPTKIQAEHHSRVAIVYVRQSTQQQILEHRESTARQYALADRAVALGWPRERVRVIDEDQGQSGSSAETRMGFQKLLSEVSLDRVGIIFGLEMSRLARSCKDWHVLLELCALYHTLLADADGVYDPSDYNDRLLLGLTGIMSEAELHVLKSRLHRGKWNKAERGEIVTHAPIGYVRTAAGDFVMDPDEQVQAVVRLIFEQYAQCGTVSGVSRWLVRQDIKLPVRPHYGPHRGELQWHRPNRTSIRNLLRHPIYAGAYRWGHRPVDPRKKSSTGRGTGRTIRSYDTCAVLIHKRFPSYITWEQFEENQRQLTESSSRGRYGGAPRSGPSVLAGLVVCGRCQNRMLVDYGRSGNHRYGCRRAAVDYVESCFQGLTGSVLDDLVTERILQVVSPASLQLQLSAADDLQQQRARLDTQWKQRVERAAYACELARRQYAAVDPENRLVARELERRWEESLQALEKLQEDHAQFKQECPMRLTADERAQILALSHDLPTLWHASTTTPEDRQVIARLLLDGVIVSIEGDTNRVDIELRWTGGFVSRHALRRPVRTYQQLSNYSQLLERIDTLREEGRPLSDIAEVLNREGFHPPKRAIRFTSGMLGRFLRDCHRPSGPRPRTSKTPALLLDNEWWLADLAREIGMPTVTLLGWQRKGWVQARKLNEAGGRWAIFADAEELTRLRRLRQAPRQWPTPYPGKLTTPKSRTRVD